MNPLRKLLLFLYLGFFIAAPVFAKPEVDSSLTAQKISIQETTELKIEAFWPRQEAQYVFAFPELPVHNLTVIRQGQSQETFRKGEEDWIRKTFTFELKPEQTGKASIREFDLPYIDPVLQKGGKFEIPRFELEVTKAPLSGRAILLMSIGVASFFLLSALIFLKVTHKPKVVETITPQQAAARKIQSLAMDAEADDRKGMLYVIGAEFRDFLTENYQLKTNKFSDDELLSELKSKNVVIEDREKIKKIFDRMQEAKYMGAKVTADELKILQRDILRFIEGKKIYGNP